MNKNLDGRIGKKKMEERLPRIDLKLSKEHWKEIST